MARLPIILAFAILLGQAAGLSAFLAAEQGCTEKCPGDSPDGTCPPACQFCACCTAPRTLPPESGTTMPVPAVGQRVPSRGDEAPPSAEPREILHVPKLALA